jgi:hypothetical protein
MFLSTINLPWPIAAHAGLLLVTGLLTAYRQKPGTSPHLYATTSLLGVTTAILGLAYLGTAYMPVEQNQFLYASVPVRMVVGCTLALTALLNGGKMSREGWRTHVAFAVYDGLGAVWLGWYLGRWDGRCPGY